MDAIIITGLCKKFGWFLSRRKVVAVDNLDLSVPEQTIFGFLGPNGAGKTTTIKILLGLILPDKGESRIFGISSHDKDVRGRVGFLPENPYFYNHLSARDFLAFCGKLMRLGRADRLNRADELLERVGLTKAAHQKLEGFSRGMLQRVGIAQALISDPDLIILDEPITGLDPVGRREVKRILLDLRDEGKTIFFSSHILSDVEQMCDEIGILNHGRLVERGVIADLLETTNTVVWTEGAPDDAVKKAEQLSDSVVMKDGRTGFNVSNKDAKDELVELMENSGGRIREVMSERENLEDFFLRCIQADDAGRESESEGE